MKTQSSLNNFQEYTMISPGPLAPFVGFTEAEVQKLCRNHHMPYEEIRRWYDGYLVKGQQIYNPNSVCQCLTRGETGDYWTTTASLNVSADALPFKPELVPLRVTNFVDRRGESPSGRFSSRAAKIRRQSGKFESVRPYINMDFDGLKTALIEMLSGARTRVNVTTFENHTDRSAFKSRDDVLTYMIHLGYLSYDQEKKEAFVPNEEIRQELGAEISESRWTEFDSFERDSEELLTATIERNSSKVAVRIGRIHDRYASAIWYNNENSLAAVIEIGYLATLKYYFKPVRELPTGRGFADIVYLPRPEFLSDVPALIVELKWNKPAVTTIDQIRNRQYPASLRDYTGDILMVGVTYDKKTKEHQCLIEEARQTI